MDSGRAMIPLHQTNKSETELHSSSASTSPRVQISGYLKKKRNVSMFLFVLGFLEGIIALNLPFTQSPTH